MSQKPFSVLGGTLLLVTAGFLLQPVRASAQIANWDRGFLIVPQNTTDFGSGFMLDSLKELKNAGANMANLEIPYYQDTYQSETMAPGIDTPTDQALITGINNAHGLGLQVQLTIYNATRDGVWLATIDPPDRDTWFNNYQNVLVHYAEIAQAQGVERMSLAGEMIRLTDSTYNSTNTAHWTALISAVRKVYNGKLTYNAQWDEPDDWGDEQARVGFFPQLDFIS